MLKIAIVITTTRAKRFGHKPAEWLLKLANERQDAAYELVDLRDFPMPFFDEVASNMWVPSTNEVAQRWQKRVAEFDGFVFVAGEYNHGPAAVCKNALDYAYKEWVRKPVAFFGYGGVGGARSVEQLRLNCIELQMAPVRHAVHLQGKDFMDCMQGKNQVENLAYLPQRVSEMFDQLLWWTRALKVAREQG